MKHKHKQMHFIIGAKKETCAAHVIFKSLVADTDPVKLVYSLLMGLEK